jgi:hypothetical protein
MLLNPGNCIFEMQMDPGLVPSFAFWFPKPPIGVERLDIGCNLYSQKLAATLQCHIGCCVCFVGCNAITWNATGGHQFLAVKMGANVEAFYPYQRAS